MVIHDGMMQGAKGKRLRGVLGMPGGPPAHGAEDGLFDMMFLHDSTMNPMLVEIGATACLESHSA